MSATSISPNNVVFLKQQVSALLLNTSSAVKFICIVTVFGYSLSYFEHAVKILSVTPGYFFPPSFWIWTLFTFCFLELHLWEVIIDVITVGLCGKLIEPSWGQLEMLTYFGITNIGVGILTSLYYLTLYVCTKNEDLFFKVHIHGLAGYWAALSVAVRQIMPDHLIARTYFGKFTNRNIPLSMLSVFIILWIISVLDGVHSVMYGFGLILSWIYLRFFQKHSNGTKGDGSENFTFASFFPSIIQPFVNVIVQPIYICSLKFGIINKISSSKTVTEPLSYVNITIPGVDPHDLERRRQIALKALSERLSKTTDASRQNILPKSYPINSQTLNSGSNVMNENPKSYSIT